MASRGKIERTEPPGPTSRTGPPAAGQDQPAIEKKGSQKGHGPSPEQVALEGLGQHLELSITRSRNLVGLEHQAPVLRSPWPSADRGCGTHPQAWSFPCFHHQEGDLAVFAKPGCPRRPGSSALTVTGVAVIICRARQFRGSVLSRQPGSMARRMSPSLTTPASDSSSMMMVTPSRPSATAIAHPPGALLEAACG